MNQLMKRVLSVLLVVCLLCSALPSAFAAEGGGFTDVSKDRRLLQGRERHGV